LYEELATGTDLTIRRSTDLFDLALHVDRQVATFIYEIDRVLFANESALICRRVTTRKSIAMTLAPAETYVILEFTDVDFPESDLVVALVSMKGLTPLVEHRRLDDEWVWIPLVDEITKFNLTIRFPFRPATDGYSGTVTLERVFALPKDGLCGSKSEVSLTSPGGSVACLRSIVGSEDREDEGWVALSAGTSRAVTAAGEASQITGDGWRLDLFPANGESLVLLPSIYTIPEAQVFLHLPRKSVEEFAKRGLPIFVNCSRADRMEGTCVADDVSTLVERSENGHFEVFPCRDSDFIISPFCEGLDGVFCQMEVTIPKRTVVQYGNASGIFEVGNRTEGALLPGVSRQVVGPRGPVRIYKTWPGVLEFGETLEDPGKLTITAKLEENRTIVHLAFCDVPIPFSAELYYNDTDRFFRAAAVQLPDSGYGYGPDTVTFTDFGELVVNRSLLDLDALEKGVDVSLLIDIPPALVTEQELIIEGANLSLYEIIGIAAGGVAFLAIIVVLVVCLVLKRRKQHTTGSGESEGIEEGLAEAGNAKSADRAAYEMYVAKH
jgi:hypothetical protein